MLNASMSAVTTCRSAWRAGRLARLLRTRAEAAFLQIFCCGGKWMKAVGIVGGMGPEATADLYAKIIRNTKVERDQDHIRVVIDSNPAIPDRTAFILGQGPDPRPAMIAGARNVVAMGAEIVAVPCNTAHFFHDDIQQAVHAQVLHIMQLVAAHLQGRVRRVGLLATSGTLRTGLYEAALQAVGVETVVPDGPGQERVMQAIYQGVKAGRIDAARQDILPEAEALVARGAEAVIAGCTEVPLVLHSGDIPVELVDATDVLARACVQAAGGALRQAADGRP